MGQSLVKNFIHIVFSTKHRQPLIDSFIEEELHSYIGGICKETGCTSLIVGGYSDHIHILCLLSKKIALVKLLEEIKSHSSKWIKTKGEAYKEFYWQDGYGAFSVNPSEIETVTAYIKNQKNIITKKHSRMNTGHFLKSIMQHTMNSMCGISYCALSGLC
jgi:putative transposase